MRKRKSHEWISADDFRRALRIYRHPVGICGHRVTPFCELESVVPTLRYFTVLRDPAKRCVSHFLHFHRGRMDSCTPADLRTFCADPHQRNVQTRWLCGTEDAAEAIRILNDRVSFVGLTERFDESMVLFRKWLDCDDLLNGYDSINRCHQKPAWTIWDDPELVRMVEEANRADLEVYRYAADVLFPRQVEAYGPNLPVDVRALQEYNRGMIPQKEAVRAKLKRNWVYKPMLHLRLA